MSFRLLKKLWAGFNKKRNERERVSVPIQSRFLPITAGLRVDFSVPTGTGEGTPASQFVWVSPAESSRSLKALKALLLYN